MLPYRSFRPASTGAAPRPCRRYDFPPTLFSLVFDDLDLTSATTMLAKFEGNLPEWRKFARHEQRSACHRRSVAAKTNRPPIQSRRFRLDLLADHVERGRNMFAFVFVPSAQLRSCRVRACQKRPSWGGNDRDAAKGHAHGTPEGQDLTASISVCWLRHFASAVAIWRLAANARGRALGPMPRTVASARLRPA